MYNGYRQEVAGGKLFAILILLIADPQFGINKVAAVAEWYRYRTMACFVTVIKSGDHDGAREWVRYIEVENLNPNAIEDLRVTLLMHVKSVD
ncbi:hypothetical protein TNCV_1359971 [Trichonephila clavipes]|nr:hypothetical protein TNCV_1359971 [Trichonephila clavipes]